MSTEPQTVEAEVVESAGALVISKMKPGEEIEANFEALEQRIRYITEMYTDLVVTEDYLSQAKKDRAYLNGLSKSLNQRRIDVKNEYMRPYVHFEERVKALDAPIKTASQAIDEQVKAFEAQAKAEKREEIRQHWLEYAGALAEAVGFEAIEDPKWTNASVSIRSAFESVERTVERIARDEQTLTELNLSHPIEAKAEYFATLDLSKAIARSKALDDQEERARKLEEEKAAAAAWAKGEEAAHDVLVEEVPGGPTLEQTLAAPVAEAVPTPTIADEAPEWTIRVSCTRDQIERIVSVLKGMGLKGTVTR